MGKQFQAEPTVKGNIILFLFTFLPIFWNVVAVCDALKSIFDLLMTVNLFNFNPH